MIEALNDSEPSAPTVQDTVQLDSAVITSAVAISFFMLVLISCLCWILLLRPWPRFWHILLHTPWRPVETSYPSFYG